MLLRPNSKAWASSVVPLVVVERFLEKVLLLWQNFPFSTAWSTAPRPQAVAERNGQPLGRGKPVADASSGPRPRPRSQGWQALGGGEGLQSWKFLSIQRGATPEGAIATGAQSGQHRTPLLSNFQARAFN